MAGVEVTLEKSSNMEFKRSYKTDKDGMYSFDCLSEGIYSLTFVYRGFITERLDNFTYKPPFLLKLDRELQLDPAFMHVFHVPSNHSGKPLKIVVRDIRSSDYLKSAQIAVVNSNGTVKKSADTNVCGNATILLNPETRYSVRISKNGYQEELIGVDMPNGAKELEIFLRPMK